METQGAQEERNTHENRIRQDPGFYLSQHCGGKTRVRQECLQSMVLEDEGVQSVMLERSVCKE